MPASLFRMGRVFGTSCMPRYSAISWHAPDEGATVFDTNVTLAVELTLAPSRGRNDPTALLAAVTAPDASVVVSVLNLVDAGYFAGSVDVPGPGQYVARLLNAPNLDAGARTFSADFSAPTFSTAIFPGPGRRTTTGFTEADPQIGFSGPFRRDEFARLRVRSDRPVLATTLRVQGRWQDQGSSSSLAFVPMAAQVVTCHRMRAVGVRSFVSVSTLICLLRSSRRQWKFRAQSEWQDRASDAGVGPVGPSGSPAGSG